MGVSSKVGDTLSATEIDLELAGDLSHIQLATRDIEPGVLEGEGTGLLDALEEQGIDLSGDAYFEWEVLPTEGWRLVKQSADGTGVNSTIHVTFAAPEPLSPGSWTVAEVFQHRGQWHYAGSRRNQTPREGRAARRRDLRLGWTLDRFTTRTGDYPVLRARLTNAGSETWYEHEEDQTVVVLAWLKRLDTGESLPSRHWLSYEPWQDHDKPLELAPGASIELPVRVMTNGANRLIPGTYEISGVISAVELWSLPGVLVVEKAPGKWFRRLLARIGWKRT
ncbi:MAG: hypothetical protein M1134_00410 [Actinobacteria bacterium]|jgi:hypothetical protein|nr:hypothetical protein [Actinomycetota bacterium]MCL5445458.1 hypothetical protein [Actinomycetota bacterium]